MPQSSTLYLGMEVPTESSAVADVSQDHGAEVTYLGTIGTRQGDIDQLLRKRPSKANHRVFVDEAGPWGAGLDRYRMKTGDPCGVVAPSLIPQKAGDRVNTDRRDAPQRARLLRSGDLTPVYVPTVEEEASRDLTRAREDPSADLKAAKFRLTAFLLRHALRYTGQAAWGPAHLRWRSEIVWPTPAPPSVFQEDLRAVTEQTARLQRLEQELPAQVNAWRLTPGVAALQARRGVPGPGAVTTVAELGDRTRVHNPRALMKCLGVPPSAYATGERRRQGAMTKTGPPPARRALVEGAWAYRSPAQVSRHLPRRLEHQPKVIQDLRWNAQVRRCQRDRRLLARGHQANQRRGGHGP